MQLSDVKVSEFKGFAFFSSGLDMFEQYEGNSLIYADAFSW